MFLTYTVLVKSCASGEVCHWIRDKFTYLETDEDLLSERSIVRMDKKINYSVFPTYTMVPDSPYKADLLKVYSELNNFTVYRMITWKYIFWKTVTLQNCCYDLNQYLPSLFRKNDGHD